jgi:hypothetical protein
MTYRIVTTVGLLSLAVAAAASAQGDVRGTVKAVDPAGRIVYFTDGSIAELKPGASLPGGVDLGAVDRSAAMQTAGDAALASPSAETHPPFAMQGTIATIDQQSGLITLDDGQVIHVTERTVVWHEVPPWQQVQVVTLAPGMMVGVVRPLGATSSQPVYGHAASDQGTMDQPAPTDRSHKLFGRRLGARGGESGTIGGALPRAAIGDAHIDARDVQIYLPPQTP